MSPFSTERPIRGVNLVLLSSGGEIHIDDIVTAAEGQTILDDIDGAIIAIEDQLATDRGRSDPVWRSKAEKALRRKRRQRPALQQRIGDLHRDPAAANAAAVAAVDAWNRTGRGRAVSRPFAVVITGRRPGQTYDLFPVRRDPHAEQCLGFADLGIIARAA